MEAARRNADPTKVVDVDLYGEVKRWPYPYYEVWATTPPFYIISNDYPQAVCSRFEDTRSVLQDFTRFSSVKQPYPGTQGFYYFNAMPTVTDSDPPVHSRRRRFMAPAFTPRRLVSLEAQIGEMVDGVLDQVEPVGDVIDFVKDVAKPIALHTLLTLVCGINEDAWPIMTDLVSAQRRAFSELAGKGQQDEDYQRAWERAREYCAKIIEERRARPIEDDLVSDLVIDVGGEGKITGEELFATLFILYSAGIGGLTTFPSWLLWRLTRHPDQLRLLQAQPELIQGALTESLRMEPSSFASIRYATQDFTFEGLEIFKGMPVHTLSASGNYDPNRFPDPMRFDITRRISWQNLTSFGHGVHHCIGNTLARLMTRICVEKTLRRFPGIKAVDTDARPRIEGVLKNRALSSLPLRLD
jgi:cytochrome P450